nr:zinc finger, CCHC-type, retrotransposon Gag domain protein [Tanacetum cinerariifolium]
MPIRGVSLLNSKLEIECYLRYLHGREWYDLVTKESWHHGAFEEGVYSIRQTNTETSTKFMQHFLRLAGFLGATAGTEEEQAKNFQWDRRGGSDNRRSSNNNYSGSNNRNSGNGRDQRNRGQQSNRSANSGNLS